MSGLEARLGMHTAWRAFESENGPEEGASGFERALRSAEEAVSAINLEKSAVHLAAEIAALAPDLPDLDADRRLALILLIVASMASLQEGSTRMIVDGPEGVEKLQTFLLALHGGASAEEEAARTLSLIQELLDSGAASAVIGRSPDAYTPLLYLPPCLYNQRMLAGEIRLAERLAALLAGSVSAFEDDLVAESMRDLLDHPPIIEDHRISLSAEQEDAVRATVSSALTIISGGPGTGKTSIVLAILRLLARLGIKPEEIALAAPTGKAAYRMGESIRSGLSHLRNRAETDLLLGNALPEPQTLHRLLGYRPRSDRFLHHHNNPLSQSVIIVDESSMIDLGLMASLTGAIRPGSRLILLGDADQLPSVQAGAVFRDLLPEAWQRGGKLSALPSAAFVRLTRSYRMDPSDPAGQSILSVASRVNDGESEVFGTTPEGIPLMKERAAVEELTFSFVEFLEPQRETLSEFLHRWEDDQLAAEPEIEELIRKDYRLGPAGFDQQESAQLKKILQHRGSRRILCLTRVFETGSNRINARLHARAADRAGQRADRFPFLVGEPILVLQNDYERMLFNGDQGIILRIKEQGKPPAPMAVFSRGDDFEAFHLQTLAPKIELCYAMTVHKAQGSEFDAVALILPEQELPLLSREILYTALTRSRNSVTVIGEKSLLASGIRRRIVRTSGLDERLALAL